MSKREETIRQMLERFNEAQAQKKGEGGIGGQFSSADLTWDETTWTRSYAELDRCLLMLRMKSTQGSFYAIRWWHLRHRYLQAQTVRREIHMRKTKHGQRVPQSLPNNMEILAGPTYIRGSNKAMVTVRVWDWEVNPGHVRAGIEWIGQEFRGTPELFSEIAA